MSTIRVAIDTSIFRGESLSGGPMEALARFAEQGHVEILIPYVVAEEYKTNPSPRIESMEELRKTLSHLREKLPKDMHQVIADFQTCIETEFDRLEASARKRFDEWKNRTGATIENPSLDHAEKVFAKYFGGKPPFKTVKARKDIPDAFIVEVMIGLSAEGPLLVASKDEGIINALKGVENITIFKTVKQLLESDDFSEGLGEIGVDVKTEYEAENAKNVALAFIRDWTTFKDRLADEVGTEVSGRTLRYRNPHYDEKDGYDELYISSSEDVYDWKFDGESDYLGEGVILVNFDARINVDVDDPMSGPHYDDDGNLDATREVRVLGVVTITLDPAVLQQFPKSWSGAELQKVANVSVDELDIDLVARSY